VKLSGILYDYARKKKVQKQKQSDDFFHKKILCFGAVL